MKKEFAPAFVATGDPRFYGLSKREYAAIHITAGMASVGMVTGIEGTYEDRARWAVNQADALLAELAK